MPQLAKRGKWVFGRLVVGPCNKIKLPPEARREPQGLTARCIDS